MAKARVQCTSSLQRERIKIWQAVVYLSEDVWQDLLDVLDIYFVDESIEGLAQGVPSHALKLGTRLVIGFTHHLWHVHSFCLQALTKENAPAGGMQTVGMLWRWLNSFVRSMMWTQPARAICR